MIRFLLIDTEEPAISSPEPEIEELPPPVDVQKDLQEG